MCSWLMLSKRHSTRTSVGTHEHVELAQVEAAQRRHGDNLRYVLRHVDAPLLKQLSFGGRQPIGSDVLAEPKPPVR